MVQNGPDDIVTDQQLASSKKSTRLGPAQWVKSGSTRVGSGVGSTWDGFRLQVGSSGRIRNAGEDSGDKAPGPDGYSCCFFRKNWDVVGHNVVQAVQHFFFLPRSWLRIGKLLLCVIPNSNSHLIIKDIRLIACKCVTKVLANRIQPLLPSLICPCQSGFAKGRLSTLENVLLMQEITKNYHKDKGRPRCANGFNEGSDWAFFFA
ncbi:hypothetical protein Vadar_032054 [Vaccinium darrowii]|uniref:Uncharacterized protein n=1 Tax=Vaccinium darrowii TaxID=229202 RepID=A0ACB7X6A9_9ERIC|nr:hypothetical protein Vadar_032054 [Vaccinium darrowii]